MPLTTPPPVPGWHLIAILPLAVSPSSQYSSKFSNAFLQIHSSKLW